MSARSSRGFTLLELLVVVTIIAIAAGAVLLAMPQTQSRQLEREAVRLSALLESARHRSRLLGRPVWWRPTREGFEFVGLAPDALPHQWLQSPPPQVQGSVPLLLGPEPVLTAQRLRLTWSDPSDQPGPGVEVYTDGVSSFEVRTNLP